MDNKKLVKDIVFLIGIFLVIFVALSVYSYSPEDPSFSNIIFTDYQNKVGNIFGKVGAYVADLFGLLFGWASLLIPLFMIYVLFVYNKFRKGIVKNLVETFFSIALIIVIVMLISLLSGFLGEKDFFFKNKNLGGLIGRFSSDFIAPIIGNVGGIILMSFCIIIAIMMLLKISIFDIKLKFNLKKILPEKKEKKKIEKNILIKKKNNKNIEENKKEEKEEIVKQKVEENDTLEIKPLEINAPIAKKASYQVPLELLDDYENPVTLETEQEYKNKAVLLEQKLKDFGVTGKIRGIQPGPVVTRFEFEPSPGIKISKIANLENDLSLAMSALSVRIIAPIPGKSVVGIELPNKTRAIVSLKEILELDIFNKLDIPLIFAMGKDISGKPYITDIAKMPHLLIAGTTGSGKSVSVNTLICSIVFKSSPDKVNFVMIDPKMVELSVYEGIPHLAAPVVTDPRKAATVLKNVVEEMERRYSILAEQRVRNIDSYNSYAEKNKELEKLPYLIVIIDEFADLMIVAGKEVENSIVRIAQMARAVGIHLILATQRPSVNVITGIIKANMPSRLSFKVSSRTDSRTILDSNGAEMLLGKGDSLFLPPGSSELVRVHGCFVSEKEVGRIVEYLKTLGEPEYNMDLIKDEKENIEGIDESDLDEKYYEALEFVKTKQQASISMIQRHLRIGYNRAARIIEIMEQQGIVGPSDGTSRPREVLIKE
jgi:S-DNA-T family DNA segregation ATPase FtsK/SpoIIIE